MLDVALASRMGDRPTDLGHIIEIPNKDWAVSEEGLYSLHRPYHIPLHRLIDSHENWPDHMRAQSWADLASFEEAYRSARLILRRAR